MINALSTALAEEKSYIRFLKLVNKSFAILEKTKAFNALVAKHLDGKIDFSRFDMLSTFMSKAPPLGGVSALSSLFEVFDQSTLKLFSNFTSIVRKIYARILRR